MQSLGEMIVSLQSIYLCDRPLLPQLLNQLLGVIIQMFPVQE